MKYLIHRNEAFTGRKPLKVEYDGDPPCLFCNQPVTSPSTDGPLVCGTCDCGCNNDGRPWTREENKAAHENFNRRIEEIIKGQI